MTAVTDAIARLGEYNLDPFNIDTNPFGLTGTGGTDTNLEPMLADIATVGQAAVAAETASDGSAAAAAASASSAATSAATATTKATAASTSATAAASSATTASTAATTASTAATTATGAATTATTKASEAASSATAAAGSATAASGYASTASTGATTASTAATTATGAATTATTKAGEASASATAAASSATAAATSATAALAAVGGVKVTTSDTTPAPLNTKLSVSGLLSKSTTSPGGNEGLALAVTASTASTAATGAATNEAVTPAALAGWTNALTELTSGQVDPAADFLAAWDASVSAMRKVKPANLGIGGGSAIAFKGIVYKTASYSLTVGDASYLIDVNSTSATTMTLPAPAVAGNGFTVAFYNSGSSTVTFSSSGLISSYALGPQKSAIVTCDGTHYRALGNGAFESASLLNASNKTAGITLSNGNLTATSTTTGTQAVVGTQAASDGRRYVEAVWNGAGFVGFASSSWTPAVNDVGVSASVWAMAGSDGKIYTNNTYYSYGTPFSNGDVIGLFADFTGGSGAVKIYFSKQGNMMGGGDPLAGTSPAASNLPTNLVPVLGPASNGASMTIRFSPSSWQYQPPAGWTYWL